MICPRCGNEWDASRSPCTRCGLVIRLPNQSRVSGRTSSTSQKFTSQPSSNAPQGGQWSRDSALTQPSKQQSGNWQPSTGTPSDSQHTPNPPVSNGPGSSYNTVQSFSSSPSRGMSSTNDAFSAPVQQAPSPFSQGGKPGNSGSGLSSLDPRQSPAQVS